VILHDFILTLYEPKTTTKMILLCLFLLSFILGHEQQKATETKSANTVLVLACPYLAILATLSYLWINKRNHQELEKKELEKDIWFWRFLVAGKF